MQAAKQKIADLLKKTIGLNVTSFSDANFQRALGTRMKALRLDDCTDYFNQLSLSLAELRRLVEEVVVPETWFFRDLEPFVFLTDYISKSKKELSNITFRILSLPCSTGEEPYSIAMTLMQAGLKPSEYHIDAVDISGQALAVAREGVYKKNSFRTTDLTFRDNYFHKVGDDFVIQKMIREKVHFFQGNMLQPAFMESLGQYDVVFCRNVLIYFNKEAQYQVIESISNLLRAQGLLFTGHSEASLFIETRFQPVSHSMAFSFYKRHVEQGKTVRQRSFKSSTPADRPPVPASLSFRRPKPTPDSQSPVRPQQPEPDEYEVVRQLADKGQLEEAASRCETYLRLNDHSAKWYCLLGIIRDNQGNQEEAMKLLRNAVYLAPGNVESLIQLSLLTERAGDPERAATYKKRVQRIKEEGNLQ